MNYDDIIQHHGVKGMRWGVRKMYENHKENLRYKYRKKGLSEEDVEKKLKRRLAAEKIGLAPAIGLAGAAVAAKKLSNARNRTKTRENDVEYNRKYRKKV